MPHRIASKPLSHAHHQALFIAKRLRDEREGAREAFVAFWLEQGQPHFRIEEEVLLPGSGLAGPGSDDDVARMLDEHLEIRRRARRAVEGEASGDELHQLGVLLTAHVRFEERELFPRIEFELGEQGLEVLAARLAEAGA